MHVKISGTGCSLMDRLYTNISFSKPVFQRYISKRPGDGGLTPGKLVFTEEFEQFAGIPYSQAFREITGGAEPARYNIGGPAVVALIGCAQLLQEQDITVNFFGTLGNDEAADKILSILRKTPIDIDGYVKTEGITPFTDVLSDPSWDNGHGERAFINHIGAAENCTPDMLGGAFWDGDILLFGGTALVPVIHDNLTELTEEGKSQGKITVVTTVYDFRNEKLHPGARWPLGDSGRTLKNTDLFIADYEEALNISGTDNIDDAVDYFYRQDTGACIITHGAGAIHAFSKGTLFREQAPDVYPVSAAVKNQLLQQEEKPGDTTGCGDNFAGGVLASVAAQLKRKRTGELDLSHAVAWGAASGGFTCFYIGGMYSEKQRGEKFKKTFPLVSAYKSQIRGTFEEIL